MNLLVFIRRTQAEALPLELIVGDHTVAEVAHSVVAAGGAGCVVVVHMVAVGSVVHKIVVGCIVVGCIVVVVVVVGCKDFVGVDQMIDFGCTAVDSLVVVASSSSLLLWCRLRLEQLDVVVLSPFGQYHSLACVNQNGMSGSRDNRER